MRFDRAYKPQRDKTGFWKEDGIVVLSLFDGVSCGRLALERAGIKVRKYYASETDVYAMRVAQYRYPDTIQLGDVTKWRDWDIETPDLILGGFPCQSYSLAGKQLKFDDPRGALLFDFVSIKDHYKPYYFIGENVRMDKLVEHKISRLFNCLTTVDIDSSLVSAQNRYRLYWTDIPDVKQPRDKKEYLSDIIEAGVVDRDKSFCIDANYWKGTNVEQYLKKSRRQIAFTERRTDEAKRIRKEFQQKYGRDFFPRRAKELVARDDGKMNCLTAAFSLKEHTLIDEKLYYRMLTPLECERLQTLPDGWTDVHGVSRSQRYKMIGNGWTVDVISHILSHIPK